MGVSVKAGSVATVCAEGKLHACKTRIRTETTIMRLVFIVPPEMGVSAEEVKNHQLVDPS
jgi:hypothetical protein